MQEVVKQLSEQFVRLGHHVTVATSFDSQRDTLNINDVVIEQFKISGNSVRGFTGESSEIDRFVNFVEKSSFDVVAIFAAQQWGCDLILERLDRINAKKVFVPTGFSGLSDSSYEFYFEKMKKYLRLFDLNIFLGIKYQDYLFAKNNNITNFKIIPNGASEEEFESAAVIDMRKQLKIGKKFLILHIGSHTGEKGHRDLFKIFFKARIKNAVLVLNGNTYSLDCFRGCRWRSLLFNLIFRKKKVILTNLNRLELVSLLRQSDVFLFPSNIECSPIVLYESCAAGVPFISSTAGNSEEISQNTGGGIAIESKDIGNSRKKINVGLAVKALEKLYNDKEFCQLLGKKGKDSWRQNYTWEKIAKEYLNAYVEIKRKG